VSRKQPVSLPTQILRSIAIAETAARSDSGQDSGTGFTILKLQRHQPPLATLAAKNAIGATEVQAAKQIALAAFSVHSGGILRAVDLQKTTRGRQNDNPWPAHVAVAVRNYQDWQRHWTNEHHHTGNPMLQVIWSAVVDERPISVIAQEIGYGRHKTARAIVCGLRHYAAWAKMVTGTQAIRWIGEAQHVFDRRLISTTG
jgi:hypothetical protein